jgi:glycosyltransferase involved in cell wall biosynthesis
MAVRDGETYLKEAVESILAQSLFDWELIAIDDGSSDGSLRILEEFQRSDARIKVFKKPKIGLTKCLNFGIGLSKSEFVARMDADDISHPMRFAAQVQYLDEHPSVVAVGTQVRYISSSGVPLFVRRMPIKSVEIERCHLSEWGGFLVHPSVMMRMSAVSTAGGYDETFICAQDYDLWFRLARIGGLANLDKVFLDYRYHSTALTQARAELQSAQRDAILRRELKLRGMQSPLDLDRAYHVRVRDTEWLLRAAAGDGFFRTTWKCWRTCRSIWSRDGLRDLMLLLRVFWVKMMRVAGLMKYHWLCMVSC